MYKQTVLDGSLKTVAKGFGIVFIGAIIVKILGSVNTILLARFLGAGTFGLFSLGLSVFAIITAISMFGLGDGVIRFVSYYKAKARDDKVKSTIWFGLNFCLILSVSSAILLFFLAEKISIHVFDKEDLKIVLQIFSIALPFYVLSQILAAPMTGFKEVKYPVYIQGIAMTLAKILVFLSFIYVGYRLYGAIIAFIIASFLGIILSLWIIQKRLFPIFRSGIESAPIGKELFLYSWPLTLSTFTVLIFSHSDVLLLGYFKASEDVGIYSVALSIAILLGFVLRSFASIFFPVISELYAKEDISELSRVYKVTTRWSFLITLPAFLFIIFFSREILWLLFGSNYITGSTTLIILAFGFFLSTVAGLTGYVLNAIGKTKVTFGAMLSGSLCNVGLNILLIPPFGIVGAAIGTAVGLVIRMTLGLFFLYRIMKIHPYDKIYGKIIVISLLTILLVFVSANIFIGKIVYWYIIIIAPVYFGIYLFLLIKTKCFRDEDKMILRIIQKKTGMKLKFLDRLLK